MLAATLFSGATSTACCSAAKLVYAGRRRPFTASHVSAAVCVALEEPAMGTVATLPAAAALMMESVRPSSPPGAVQTPTAPAPCLYDEGLPSRGLGVSMMNGDATLDDHFARLIAVGCQPPGLSPPPLPTMRLPPPQPLPLSSCGGGGGLKAQFLKCWTMSGSAECRNALARQVLLAGDWQRASGFVARYATYLRPSDAVGCIAAALSTDVQWEVALRFAAEAWKAHRDRPALLVDSPPTGLADRTRLDAATVVSLSACTVGWRIALLQHAPQRQSPALPTAAALAVLEAHQRWELALRLCLSALDAQLSSPAGAMDPSSSSLSHALCPTSVAIGCRVVGQSNWYLAMQFVARVSTLVPTAVTDAAVVHEAATVCLSQPGRWLEAGRLLQLLQQRVPASSSSTSASSLAAQVDVCLRFIVVFSTAGRRDLANLALRTVLQHGTPLAAQRGLNTLLRLSASSVAAQQWCDVLTSRALRVDVASRVHLVERYCHKGDWTEGLRHFAALLLDDDHQHAADVVPPGKPRNDARMALDYLLTTMCAATPLQASWTRAIGTLRGAAARRVVPSAVGYSSVVASCRRNDAPSDVTDALLGAAIRAGVSRESSVVGGQ